MFSLPLSEKVICVGLAGEERRKVAEEREQRGRYGLRIRAADRCIEEGKTRGR
jgi:hypothetical protein